MKHFEQEINWFGNSKILTIIMGFLMTSFIAVLLTVAGLLTTNNWSIDRSSFSSKFKGDRTQQTQLHSSKPSFSPFLLQLKPSYDGFKRRSSVSRVARYDGMFDGYEGGITEKSDFYYILPILLVIGLGSFLIPIISTFFTAMVTSSGAIGGCCGRRKRRGIEPIIGIQSVYDIWVSVEKAIEKLSDIFENE